MAWKLQNRSVSRTVKYTRDIALLVKRKKRHYVARLIDKLRLDADVEWQ